MKKNGILMILILGFILLMGVVSAEDPTMILRSGCGPSFIDVNSYSVGDIVYVKVTNLDPNEHYSVRIKGTLGNACDAGQVIASKIMPNVDATGKACVNTTYIVKEDDCGKYKVIILDRNNQERITENYIIEDNSIPMVPEFNKIIGILTAFGALGVFFLIRRKY